MSNAFKKVLGGHLQLEWQLTLASALLSLDRIIHTSKSSMKTITKMSPMFIQSLWWDSDFQRVRKLRYKMWFDENNIICHISLLLEILIILSFMGKIHFNYSLLWRVLEKLKYANGHLTLLQRPNEFKSRNAEM